MKMRLLTLELKDFKGFKEQVFGLNGKKVIVTGKNGSGKTTLSTAFYWLFADRDYDLNSNPAVRPINSEECTPTVIATLDIDGKIVKASKSQKRTVSKPDSNGISKVALSNTYEINSVPKSYRDFCEYFTELGVNLDRFLVCSHPLVFVGQKAADMRKVLFDMTSSKSDYEVACMTEGAGDVAEMLLNYSLEEVSAIEKSTLRSISETYGKEGELLRAKIEGLESAKVDIDIAELELGKADCLRRIESVKSEIASLETEAQMFSRLSDELMNLKFAQGDYVRSLNSKNLEKRKSIEDKIRETKLDATRCHSAIVLANGDIEGLKKTINQINEQIETLKSDIASAESKEMDETKTYCPVCKRKYAIARIDEIKAEFESNQAGIIKSKREEISVLKANIEAYTNRIETESKTIAEKTVVLDGLEKIIANLEAELSGISTDVNAEDTPTFKDFAEKISSVEAELSRHDVLYKKVELNVQLESVQKELIEYEKKIGSVSVNENIDNQISELREKQIQIEQNKADAENILYQVDLVSRKKNELLTSEINEHFDIASFELFEYAKNGNYKECCNVYIDERKYGESTNTGREILAELDIVNGLQKFYGQFYPIFVDSAERMSKDTFYRLPISEQTIFLTVSNLENVEIEVTE